MPCQPHDFNSVYNCLFSEQSCFLCDQPSGHAALCLDCEAELPWLVERCTVCALPLALDGFTCNTCHRRPPAFNQVEAPWHYGFPVDTLIHRFKHRAHWPAGQLLTQLLAAWLTQRYSDGLPRPQQLLAVPMPAARQRARGFNQAAMLRQWLSQALHIPGADHWVHCPRTRAHQQGLGAGLRQENMEGAFAVSGEARLQGVHVAIIDDVLTTGATARALAGLLKRHGAARVDVYCLARTAKPGTA